MPKRSHRHSRPFGTGRRPPQLRRVDGRDFRTALRRHRLPEDAARHGVAGKADRRGFAVSRTPVREALLRLSEGGLVDIYPQSGTVVSRVPVSAIPGRSWCARRWKAPRSSAAQIASARSVHLDAIIAPESTLHPGRHLGLSQKRTKAFHRAIAQIAGYPRIQGILRSSGTDRPCSAADTTGAGPYGECRGRARGHP